MQTSKRLKGIAYRSVRYDRKPKLRATGHIITNPKIHAKRIVFHTENFSAKNKIAIEKTRDHTTHTAPLAGVPGKVSPITS